MTKKLLFRLGCVLGLIESTFAYTVNVQAAEIATPILPAITNGVPIGATPPPGIYYSNISLFWQSRVVNASGSPIPVRINFYDNVNAIYIVPDIQILGGEYSFLIGQSGKVHENNTFGRIETTAGIFNTYFTPFSLSWSLTNGLFISTAASVYFPDGTWRRNHPSNGNAYTTFQPSLALTYLKDGWNLTANFQLNLNARNNINDYQSGNLYGVDYTVTKSFGAWTVGLQGFFIKQFEPDRIGSTIVPATIYNGFGNKAIQSGIGPLIAYDFKDFVISAWYDQNIYSRNYTAANMAWLKITVPLGNPFSASAPIPASALPDRTQR